MCGQEAVDFENLCQNKFVCRTVVTVFKVPTLFALVNRLVQSCSLSPATSFHSRFFKLLTQGFGMTAFGMQHHG